MIGVNGEILADYVLPNAREMILDAAAEPVRGALWLAQWAVALLVLTALVVAGMVVVRFVSTPTTRQPLQSACEFGPEARWETTGCIAGYRDAAKGITTYTDTSHDNIGMYLGLGWATGQRYYAQNPNLWDKGDSPLAALLPEYQSAGAGR